MRGKWGSDEWLASLPPRAQVAFTTLIDIFPATVGSHDWERAEAILSLVLPSGSRDREDA